MTGHPFYDLLLLAVPIALIAFWWTSSRARELAITHARRACQGQKLQLLDQTVSLRQLKLSRSASGGSCFRREYEFEFTDSGTHRDHGTVTMRGHELLGVLIPYTTDEEGNRIYIH